MSFWENIRIALRSVKSNFLRSFLTLIIIAVGISCLVGILTAIDTILFTMSSNFNRLGANSFTIYPSSENVRSRRQGRQVKQGEPIVFEQAMEFKERYSFAGSKTSVRIYCSSSGTCKFQNEKTNPTVRIIGIDENYFDVAAYEFEEGRNFNTNEVLTGSHKIVIGSDIVETLFKGNPSFALGKTMSVGNTKYKIVGTLKAKGSTGSSGQDRRVFLPLTKAKALYGGPKKNYTVNIAVTNATLVDEAISSATGIMRNVRSLRAAQDNDFTIRSSGSILETLDDITGEIQIGAIVIALMTLVGAAIGLMNIMLVTVTERTREIGVRKALGATSNNVLIQFLTEAVVICQLGGILGILLGMLVGLAVAAWVNGVFIIPWAWIALAITVCLVVGILSGLYPALKAARLDPIESLRYE